MSDAKFKPVILVCGKTGIGKTSLIQAVTGRETVPDSAIGTGMPVTHGFTPYETEAATFVDAEGMEPGTTVADYIAFLKGELLERLATGKSENVITNVWYCVDGPGARVQDADREIVKAFGEKVMLVVTKSEIMRKSQFETMNAAVSSLVPESRIVMVSSETKSGLDQLISRTKAMITSATGSEELAEFEAAWDSYYESRQAMWREACDSEADSFIRWGAGRSFAIALPCAIPLSDMIPLSINEAYMIMRIGSVYGETVGKNVIGILTGIAAGSVAGKFLATLMPPGLKSVVAASVTYGLGKAAKAYFRSGKTLSKEALRDEFLKSKKEGKDQKWEPVEENQ